MSVIGQNIHRRGLYAQVAYRPNGADSRILRDLEIVYRYSMAQVWGSIRTCSIPPPWQDR